MTGRPSHRIAVIALAALFGAATCSRANPPAPEASASAPEQTITDIAHWQHPTKAVFAKYKVTLNKVTVKDKYPTFWVQLPFDPQTQPNQGTLDTLCVDLLKANGHWAFALVAADDGVEVDVSWDKKARQVHMDSKVL